MCKLELSKAGCWFCFNNTNKLHRVYKLKITSNKEKWSVRHSKNLPAPEQKYYGLYLKYIEQLRQSYSQKRFRHFCILDLNFDCSIFNIQCSDERSVKEYFDLCFKQTELFALELRPKNNFGIFVSLTLSTMQQKN